MDGNTDYFKCWLEHDDYEKRQLSINKIVNKRYGEDEVRIGFYFVSKFVI